MPKLEPKTVQKDLERKLVWPVYWLYGEERMKSRELLKRIRKAVVGESALSFAEERLDGSEVDASQIIEAAQSPALGGGTRFIVIRDAHAIKDTEELVALFGPAGLVHELSFVCVFLSKDLDARKKFSKLLVESAAVVPCEKVAEDEREAWIEYLARQKGLELESSVVLHLSTLEPWGLDLMERELEKFELAQQAGLENPSDVILPGLGSQKSTDEFLEGFFARRLQACLPQIERIASRPDEALPLLGLLAWNVRHLALVAHDRAHGKRAAKISPYLADRFRRWSEVWNLDEVLSLQSELQAVDFGTKQTPLLAIGLWSTLLMKFAR